MTVKIVLGTFFGDEGKGSTVQWLCKTAIAQGKKPVVVRFSGGPQAGHRVINDGIEHVCSSFGSGVLLDVPTYLTENVFVDPIALKREYDVLVEKGVNPKIYIDYSCRVITPYDILMSVEDSKVTEDGSCGRGIYYSYKRAKNPTSWMQLAVDDPELFIEYVLDYYDIPDAGRNKEYESLFIEACKWLKDSDIISFTNINTAKYSLDESNVVIFEGSQGLLLDMDCGFMPHCTPSRVGLNGIPEEFLDNAEVYLVMRTYLTRHGNGWEPIGEDLLRKDYISLGEPTNADDGAQGKFKIGAFDLNLYNRAIERHHFDNYIQRFKLRVYIVINHLDCLKDKFYYTRNGHLVSTMISSQLNRIVRFLGDELNYIPNVHIDRIYGSYKVNNIKLIYTM